MKCSSSLPHILLRPQPSLHSCLKNLASLGSHPEHIEEEDKEEEERFPRDGVSEEFSFIFLSLHDVSFFTRSLTNNHDPGEKCLETDKYSKRCDSVETVYKSVSIFFFFYHQPVDRVTILKACFYKMKVHG